MGRQIQRLVAILLGAAIGLVAAEFGFRFLLFGKVPGYTGPGSAMQQREQGAQPLSGFQRRLRELRDARRYADPYEGEVYWMLRHRFGMTGSDSPPGYDPRFGWRSGLFDGETLAHRNEAMLGARRAVLFFGDSFGKCRTAAADCFQGIANELPLAEQAVVMNYSVGGYGFDQIQLVAEATFERWEQLLAEQPERPVPVVVLAIYIEDDLDRTTMAVRDWVKPFYEVGADGLELNLPPGESTLAAVDSHGLGVSSWLLREAVYGRGWLPKLRKADAKRHADRLKATVTGLLDLLEADLAARGWEHVYLILPAEAALRQRGWNWREPWLIETLTERGTRFVNARTDFERDMQLHGRSPKDYVGKGAPLFGHYNRLGNQVASVALMRGLAGANDGGAPEPATLLKDEARRSVEVQLERNRTAPAPSEE